MHLSARAATPRTFGLALACLLAFATACGGGGGGGGTSIHLTTNTVNLAADAGGDLPIAQIMTADFNGDVIVWGIPAGGPDSPPDWLSFEEGYVYGDQGAYHLDFTVGATTTDLAPGTYSFVIRIATAYGQIDNPHDIKFDDVTIVYLVNEPALRAAGAPAAAVAVLPAAPAPVDEGLGMRVLGAASAR